MKKVKLNFIFICLAVLILCACLNVKSQTEGIQINPTQRYDELLDSAYKTPSPQPQQPTGSGVTGPEANQAIETHTITPQAQYNPDELLTLLPKLDSELYTNWSKNNEPKIWKIEDNTFEVVNASKELLSELGLEKILKQTYIKENHLVDVIIYKFKDFTGAYSAFTVLHGGSTTKLKVGRNASESDKLVNFWKESYFVDIHTSAENDSIAKEFIIFSSQEISNNIQIDQLPPVVAIQLPALNRIQGTEKYCLGSVCCKTFLSGDLSSLDFDSLNLQDSGGIISAHYQPIENTKDSERIILALIRYSEKNMAQSVFDTLKQTFERKKTENKDVEIDFDVKDSILKIKNDKNNYTMLKQKGNLLGAAFSITNKKNGEKVLDLIPWPIEITKPRETIPAETE